MPPSALLGIMAGMMGSMASSGIRLESDKDLYGEPSPAKPTIKGIVVPEPKQKKKPYGTKKLSKKQRKLNELP